MASDDAKRLQEIRVQLNLTKRKMAERLGVAENRYKNWEYGRTLKAPKAIMQKAEELLRTPNVEPPVSLRPVSLIFGQLVPIRVVGRVAAGNGEHNVDSIEDQIYVPASLQNVGGFAYIVDGESMMPALQHGDIAVFKETTTPRRGYTYLLRRQGGEYSVKNLEWRNNAWVMQSLNPAYPEESMVNVQIIGVLVGWYRSFGTYEKLESDPYGLRLDSPV